MSTNEYEVVISGIGGKFPDCHSFEEFKEKLFSKTNLTKTDTARWNPDSCSEPYKTGMILDWNKFDYSFFGVHSKLVQNSDPMMGLILERSYEAMVDAGVNPYSLKGHNVCVVSATSLSEAEVMRCAEGVFLEGLGMVGHSRTMLANRVSYIFNFTGPSYHCDSSWTGGMQALEVAAKLVSQGAVESALVTTCNITKYNTIDEEYKCMHMLSPDGVCRPFDTLANGFSRSEGAVSFFLQRSRDAKRSYCSIVKAENRFLGNRTCGFTELSPLIETFFQDFYKDCEVNPHSVSYIEARGMCVQGFDIAELNALEKTFCKKNSSPILIGSISGNVGNGEATSGFHSISKAIIALERGIIPPTINYSNANPNVSALVDGRLKPVTECTELQGDYVAVNSINFNGNVGHILLKKHTKAKLTETQPKPGEISADGRHRLVILQARNEKAAQQIVEKVQSMPFDPEFISLVNEVHKTPVPANLWRAYTVVPVIDNKSNFDVQPVDSGKTPLWWVFSGMGSQWVGMGRDLLELPVFAAAIDACDRVLRPRGLDIKHIITTDDLTIFDNNLNSFVGIAAIQLGLVDLLRSAGVFPDGIVGHSVGELGCAYADGCLTREEMILAAYARGRASLESDVVSGMMAAVGLGFNDIKDQLPETIDVACHNAVDSCTVSGPTDDVNKYVDELKAKNVFARTVNAGGVAYHSRYIRPIASKLLKYLKEIIVDPKPRSERWISSSVPESQWHTVDASLCSAEYQTNNLLNPVLFEEACKHLPSKAIVLEIAPRGLLQAILRRSLSSEVLNISMTNKSNESNVINVLNAFGKLYMNNVDIDVNALSPAVQYPVSRCTPSLADLVIWDHDETSYQGFTTAIETKLNRRSLEKSFNLSSSMEECRLWKDHCVLGNVTIPVSGLLMYPWKMMSETKKIEFGQKAVVFDSVIIKENAVLDEKGNTITVTFSPVTLKFEVSLDHLDTQSTTFILSGDLRYNEHTYFNMPERPQNLELMEHVTQGELYCSLAQFGYELGPQFQNIEELIVGESECFAKVKWTGSLAAYLDCIFKIVIFIQAEQEQVLLKPSAFDKLTIDISLLNKLPLDAEVDVYYDMRCNRVVAEAVELLGITLSPVTQDQTRTLGWRELKLIPYFDSKLSLKDFLTASVQVAAETALSTWSNKPVRLNTMVIRDESDKPSLYTPLLKEAFKFQTNIFPNFLEVDFAQAKQLINVQGGHNCLIAADYAVLETLLNSIPAQNNIYCLTYLGNNGPVIQNQLLRPIMIYQSDVGKLALIKKVKNLSAAKVFEVEGSDWLRGLKQFVAQDKSECPVIVYSHSLLPRQVLPVLAKEHFAKRLRTFFILDENAPKFSLTCPLYSTQLAVGLAVNILCKGVWSSLRTVNHDISAQTTNLDCFVRSSNENLDLHCVGLNTTSFTLNNDFLVDETEELKYVDYSGRLDGQKVMGIAELERASNSLTVDPVLRWPVPDDWTMEEAASVPVVYLLAYYIMHLKGRVRKGEDVLVHAGMSPLGQAVITIALQAEANVFASVENDEEAIKLVKTFPEINPSHVVSLSVVSQDVGLVLLNLTRGKGVEVIVNCFPGRILQSSVKVMGYDCRFLHLGKIRVEDQDRVGMSCFMKRTSFHGVGLNNVANCSEELKILLHEYVEKGIKQGTVKPQRRVLFSSSQQAEALFHLRTKHAEEKTVLIAKQFNHSQTTKETSLYNPHHLVLITGTESALWLDVAEWLVHQGVRRLVVLPDEEGLGGNYVRRFNKLMDRSKCTIALLPSSRVETHEGAVSCLKDVLRMGTVSSIFAVCMDENSSKMKSLDSASRELIPQLRQFVSLLGRGSDVSEARALGGVSVCSVQTDGTLQSPLDVMPYLSAILEQQSTLPKILIAGDGLNVINESEVLDYQSFLPESQDELARLGNSVRVSGPRFQEVVTRSPGYEQVRRCLLPVFLVPGLSPQHLEHLTRQLLHPAFMCSLPASLTSVQQYAQILLQDLLHVQPRGPYNVVGDSWSGAVALELSCLLEARGDHVELFLLEAAPSTLRDRLTALCDQYSEDLATSLIASQLNLSQEKIREVSQAKSWEEKLSACVTAVPLLKRDLVTRGLTALYWHLSAVDQFRACSGLFKGNLTLVTSKTLSTQHITAFSQFCQQSPKTVVTGDDTYHTLISSFNAERIINENVAFEY